jgi:lysophospholipase L1-like esterase
MIKYFKIIIINFLIFITLVLIVEIIFGYWFDKDNLGPYMREHRMKKALYTLKINNEEYKYVYKRNYYGFRGEEIDPAKIEAVIIGGSTTDERYKPEEFTITGYLNKNLKKNGINIEVVNAGIEGQSTRGHLSNFNVWFPKLKEFAPKYIFFYVGINDTGSSYKDTEYQNALDGFVLNPNKNESFRDNIKSRSIFYDLLRKTKHKYYRGNENKRVTYDFNLFSKERSELEVKEYYTFKEKLQVYNLEEILKKNKKRIDYYLNNIDKLVAHSYKIGATPIFINQEAQQGWYSESLFALNISLINHCEKKKYNCIDLAKKLIGKPEYWWDGMHTTATGSKKIAELITPEILSYMKK